MRLEKYLVQCGVESKKKIKTAIAQGRVTVNGNIEVNDATDVEWGEDIITFDGIIPEKKAAKILYYV